MAKDNVSDLEAVENLIDAEDAAEAEKISPFGSAPPESPAQAAAKTEKETRRAKAAREAEERETALNEKFSRLESSIGMSQQQINALREENARLSGALSVRQAPVPVFQQGPSAEELYRQADKALSGQEMVEYHRLMRAASRADAEEIADARVARLAQQIPDPRQFQQRDPNEEAAIRHIDRTLGGFPKLSELHEDERIERISAQTKILLAERHAPGPALLTRAMQEVEARITGKSGRATFARGNGISIDAHVNTGGGSSGGDDEVGTPEARALWKRAGLPMDEFKKYA